MWNRHMVTEIHLVNLLKIFDTYVTLLLFLLTKHDKCKFEYFWYFWIQAHLNSGGFTTWQYILYTRVVVAPLTTLLSC